MSPEIRRDNSNDPARLNAPSCFFKHRSALFKGEMFDDIVRKEIFDRVGFYRPSTCCIEIKPSDRACVRYEPSISRKESTDLEPKRSLSMV